MAAKTKKDLPWFNEPPADSYLKRHASHRQVFAVLQHAQVLCHECCWVHQALRGLSVIAPFRVLASHVLQPGQPQVWRGLVALGNSGRKRDSPQLACASHTRRSEDSLQGLPRWASVPVQSLLRWVPKWRENVNVCALRSHCGPWTELYQFGWGAKWGTTC